MDDAPIEEQKILSNCSANKSDNLNWKDVITKGSGAFGNQLQSVSTSFSTALLPSPSPEPVPDDPFEMPPAPHLHSENYCSHIPSTSFSSNSHEASPNSLCLPAELPTSISFNQSRPQDIDKTYTPWNNIFPSKFCLKGDLPNDSIYYLLATRCRLFPLDPDLIDCYVLSRKMWLIVLMLNGRLPTAFPVMTLRQMAVLLHVLRFVKLSNIALTALPSDSFIGLVSSLWVSPLIRKIKENQLPKNLMCVRKLLTQKQERAFCIGLSLYELFTGWFEEFAEDFYFELLDVKPIAVNHPNLPCDFFTTFQPFALSPRFIQEMNLDNVFLMHITALVHQMKYLASLPPISTRHVHTFDKIAISLSPEDVAKQFWLPWMDQRGSEPEPVPVFYKRNVTQFRFADYDWNWTAAVIIRRPRSLCSILSHVDESGFIKKVSRREGPSWKDTMSEWKSTLQAIRQPDDITTRIRAEMSLTADLLASTNISLTNENSFSSDSSDDDDWFRYSTDEDGSLNTLAQSNFYHPGEDDPMFFL